MKYMTGSEIRSMYLNFFKSKGHMIEPGASLVPANDPTLLWINSGVAALKKYFDGREIPNNPRITNAQKSIRTNDIENVGITKRHQTFFEMMGNFSIGDYFKKVCESQNDIACEIIIELGDMDFWNNKDERYRSKMVDVYNEQIKDLIKILNPG